MTSNRHLPGLTRRSFLKTGAAGAATLLLPEWLLAEEAFLERGIRPVRTRAARSVRIRGAVRMGSSGVGGVSVSDGLKVVRSAPDGSFELVSTDDRDFLRMSVPAGARIPQSPTGTARFY